MFFWSDSKILSKNVIDDVNVDFMKPRVCSSFINLKICFCFGPFGTPLKKIFYQFFRGMMTSKRKI